MYTKKPEGGTFVPCIFFCLHGLSSKPVKPSPLSSLCRCAHLHELSEERAQKLEDSKKLQQFLRDVDEVRGLEEDRRSVYRERDVCVCVCVGRGGGGGGQNVEMSGVRIKEI